MADEQSKPGQPRHAPLQLTSKSDSQLVSRSTSTSYLFRNTITNERARPRTKRFQPTARPSRPLLLDLRLGLVYRHSGGKSTDSPSRDEPPHHDLNPRFECRDYRVQTVHIDQHVEALSIASQSRVLTLNQDPDGEHDAKDGNSLSSSQIITKVTPHNRSKQRPNLIPPPKNAKPHQLSSQTPPYKPPRPNSHSKAQRSTPP